MALVVAPLVWLLLGRGIGIAWVVSLVAAELATRLATRRFAPGRTPRQSDRVAYLCSGLVLNLVWIGLSLLFWFDPSPNAPFSALLVWTCVMMGGVGLAFRSPLGLLVFAGPCSVAMLAAPILFPRFDGPQQALAAVGVLASVSYGWVSARRNLEAAQTVARTTAELVEQKQAAEAANLAKSAFLAMMSHEIRTPMNGVLGMAHALEGAGLNPRQAEYLRTLRRSGDVLMSLLDDVLDLAKIEAGRMEIAAEPFNLKDLVLAEIDLWRSAAEDKRLSLSSDIREDAPSWVMGDAVRVRQILLNLLSNAIKFTDAGTVRVVVTGAPAGAAIAVADTGPGMDEMVRSRLFQSFTQGEGGVARRHGGAGLGLAISQELAGLMGGVIEADSQVGRGATFTLHLPLTAIEPAAHIEPDEPVVPDNELRVLVVDDNATNRAVAEALLEALGARATTVSGGQEALAALQAGTFDLVLMDIHMPGMDGVEVTARIRAGEAGSIEVPIVALTADAMAGERERLMGLGFDGYLTKPINPTLLAETLAAFGEGRQEPGVTG